MNGISRKSSEMSLVKIVKIGLLDFRLGQRYSSTTGVLRKIPKNKNNFNKIALLKHFLVIKFLARNHLLCHKWGYK